MYYEVSKLELIGVHWTPSNPATLGTSQSAPIRGVALFQGLICTLKHTLGHFEVASIQGGHILGILSSLLATAG